MGLTINSLHFGTQIAQIDGVIGRLQRATFVNAKLGFAFALMFLLIAFAVQPCFAVPMQLNPGCCGHGHNHGCHPPVQQVEMCAMQSTAFAAPEQSAPSVVTFAIVSRAEHTPALELLHSIEGAALQGAIDGSGLYLRNSTLLI